MYEVIFIKCNVRKFLAFINLICDFCFDLGLVHLIHCMGSIALLHTGVPPMAFHFSFVLFHLCVFYYFLLPYSFLILNAVN